MAKHPIPEACDFVGEWWLPAQGTIPRIAGTLSWSSKRASLKLHESFMPLRGAVYGDEVHSYPTIHGTTVDSKLISVLEASGSGSGVNFGPAGLRQTEMVVSSWVVVGAHVGPETTYIEMRARMPGLQMWIGRTGVTQTILHKSEHSGPGVVYNIEGLPEEETPIPSLNATIGWGIDRTFSGDLISEISVRSSACLRVRPEEPKTLEWFIEQFGKATTVLSFLAGSPMSPDHFAARVAASGADVEALVALRQAEYCDFKHVHDFYMLRNNMGVDLGAVFSKWFGLYDSVAMPSQLTLSVFNSKDLWLHVEFLSLMQALEGFHRATMPGLYTCRSQYESIEQVLSNAIPNTVAPDHRAALKSRIKYGNEVSLRKRLEAIVGRLSLPLRQQILGGNGVVPQPWVDTRNYYTHWDEASREQVLDGLEMHRACVRMRHLLRALFLDLTGIPQDAIAMSMRNANSESQYLIQINNTEQRKRNPSSTAGALMRIDVRDAESPDESAS